MTMAMCWKCKAAKMRVDEYTGANMVAGCEDHPDIKDFADAQRLCPLIHKGDEHNADDER